MKILVIVLLGALIGCTSKQPSESPEVHINTVCVDGIVYFTTYSNNPFYGNDIGSVKIDPASLKPTTCKK